MFSGLKSKLASGYDEVVTFNEYFLFWLLCKFLPYMIIGTIYYNITDTDETLGLVSVSVDFRVSVSVSI